MGRSRIDEKVHIAFWKCLAACHRTEYPHIVGSVTGGDTQNLFAFLCY
jgi:hypothetical protein